MGKRDPKEVMKMAGFSARIVNEPGSRASISVIDKAMYQARLSKLKDGEMAMVYIITGNEKKLRTDQQNRAMHLYFQHVADALNEGGYTVHMVLKEKVDIDWNMYAVKELLWRPAQQVILQKSSTTDLRKQEDIDKVYHHLNRHLGQKFGIHVEFPSYEPGYADTAPLKTDRPKHVDRKVAGSDGGEKPVRRTPSKGRHAGTVSKPRGKPTRDKNKRGDPGRVLQTPDTGGSNENPGRSGTESNTDGGGN